MNYNELEMIVLEHGDFISSEDKEVLMLESSTKEKVFAVGGVLTAAAAISAGIATLIKNKKVKDSIESHEDLKELDSKIKNSKKAISELRLSLWSDWLKYNKLCEDSKRFADFFGKTTQQVYDGFIQYDDRVIQKHKTVANPDYDPKKAQDWKKASEDANEIMNRISDTRKSLKKELKDLKQYNKDLKQIAKKYATVDPTAIDRLNDQADKCILEVDNAMRDLDKFISSRSSLLESADTTVDMAGLKLEIFESCRNGEITDEERDELLALI